MFPLRKSLAFMYKERDHKRKTKLSFGCSGVMSLFTLAESRSIIYILLRICLNKSLIIIIRKLSFSNWFVSFFCCWGNWIYGLLCVHMIVFRWTTVPSSGWWRTWTHSMKMLYPFYKIHQTRLLLLFGRMVMSSFYVFFLSKWKIENLYFV